MPHFNASMAPIGLMQVWTGLLLRCRDEAQLAAIVGLPAQLALVASILAFSRDQEREADVVGLDLMAGAGYAPIAASEVWDPLLAETRASTADQGRNAFFATHPAPEERLETLRALAAGRGGAAGRRGGERYRARLAAIRPMLVQDELGLRQYGRTEVVLDGRLWYATGERSTGCARSLATPHARSTPASERSRRAARRPSPTARRAWSS